LYVQYNYSRHILIQNFISKHYLDTLKIRESFKSLLDRAEYFFKTNQQENIKNLNTLPIFYSNGEFDVDKIASIFNKNAKDGKYEVFKIDRNYKIVDGSYKPDIGYDLGQFKIYKKILQSVFEGKKKIDISTPHLDLSSMNLKKYYLILSPDKKYLLQLAYVVDIFNSAKEVYSKALKMTEDLKDLEVFYIDKYMIYKINLKNRNQPKLPLSVMWQNTIKILKEILKDAKADISIDPGNIKNQAIKLSKVVDKLFQKNHGVIKRLDLENHRLVIYTIIRGVFENSKSRLILKTEYDTASLENDIDSLKKRFISIFVILVMAIFLVYKLIIDKVSSEIKEIVYKMKKNEKVDNPNSFIDEIYELKNRYNDYHEQINKEIEKNKKLLEENKRFIVDTVHQIKTPMSVITLNLDFIKNMVNDREITESIEEVDAAIAMLLNSYNDLSYLASNETVEYKPQMINLSEILEERIGFFELIARANNKVIHSDIEKDIVYKINRIEFERLVDNNISNAIKYSTGKDIFVSLKKEGTNVVLRVESYGERIKNPIEVFEKNYREHSHKRGLGIGLNIVKNICEKYSIKYRTYYKDGKNVFEYVFSI